MCIFILGHRPNHITKIFSNLQSYATAQQKNKFANYVHLYLIFGSVNILMELFKKYSIDARYHLCLIIVVELIVATFLGCLEVWLRTLARSL